MKAAPKTVSDIMIRNVITLSLNHTVKEALKILHDNNISGAPVLSANGKVVGLVSSLDLIVASGMRQFNVALNDLCDALKIRKEIVHLYPHSPIKSAILLIVKKRIGRIVILDDSNKLQGIVSRKDLVKFYVSQLDK